jgi:hypothetical protein
MKFFLEIVAGPRAGSKFPLDEAPLTVGRNSFAGVSCPEDNFLSGMHCSLQITSEGVLLKDLTSTNGTFLNGQRVVQAQPRPGDLIEAGSVTMRIAVDPDRRAAPRTPAAATTNKSKAAMELFAALSAPLYCLLDAACDKAIPSLLALAQEQKQCLYEGRTATELADWAPYLVRLEADAPFTRALLDLGWGKGWASYFTSYAPFDEIRHHFRRFLMVQVEGGEEVYFRFYDPRVMRDFLPTANPDEARIFFGPVEQFLIESDEPETMVSLKLDSGALATEKLSLS